MAAGAHSMVVASGDRTGNRYPDRFSAADERPLGFIVPPVKKDALMLA